MSKRLTNKRKKIGGGKIGKRKGGDRRRVRVRVRVIFFRDLKSEVFQISLPPSPAQLQ